MPDHCFAELYDFVVLDPARRPREGAESTPATEPAEQRDELSASAERFDLAR